MKKITLLLLLGVTAFRPNFLHAMEEEGSQDVAGRLAQLKELKKKKSPSEEDLKRILILGGELCPMRGKKKFVKRPKDHISFRKCLESLMERGVEPQRDLSETTAQFAQEVEKSNDGNIQSSEEVIRLGFLLAAEDPSSFRDEVHSDIVEAFAKLQKK